MLGTILIIILIATADRRAAELGLFKGMGLRLSRTLVQLEMLTSSVFFGNVDTQYSVDHCLILPSRLCSCSTSSASATLYAGSTLLRVPRYRPV